MQEHAIYFRTMQAMHFVTMQVMHFLNMQAMYYLMIHQIQSCRPAGKRSNFLDCPFFLFKANSVSCLLMLELTWSAYLLNPKLHLSNFFQYLHFWWPVSRTSTFHPFFPSKIFSSVSPSSIQKGNLYSYEKHEYRRNNYNLEAITTIFI